MSHTHMLTIARRYVECGLSVVPLKPAAKGVDLPALCASSSFNRWGLADWRLYVRRPPSDGELRAWFGQGARNLALVTGHAGLFAVDFDDKEAFSRWAAANPESLSTAIQRTPRGCHLLFRSTRRIRSSKFTFAGVEAGDILGFPRWITTCPSAHPLGGHYTWLPGHAPWEIKIRQVEDIGEIGVEPTRYYTLRTRLAFVIPHLLRSPLKTLRQVALPRLERVPIWNRLIAARARRAARA